MSMPVSPPVAPIAKQRSKWRRTVALRRSTNIGAAGFLSGLAVVFIAFLVVQRPADAEARIAAIGNAFVDFADPVIPTLLTALVALTVAQVLATAPRMLLPSAAAIASAAVAWATASIPSIVDGFADSGKVLGTVTLASVCVLLGVAINEFTPFALAARSQRLSDRIRRTTITIDRVRTIASARARSGGAQPPSWPASESEVESWRRLNSSSSWIPAIWTVVAAASGTLCGAIADGLIGAVTGTTISLAVTIVSIALIIVGTHVAVGAPSRWVRWSSILLIVCAILTQVALAILFTIGNVGPSPWVVWLPAAIVLTMAALAIIPLFVVVPLEQFTPGGSIAAGRAAFAIVDRSEARQEKRKVRKRLAKAKRSSNP